MRYAFLSRVAKEAGALLVLDSDAHEPDDLLTPEFRLRVAKGAGLDDDEIHTVLQLNPKILLGKLGFGAEVLSHPD